MVMVARGPSICVVTSVMRPAYFRPVSPLVVDRLQADPVLPVREAELVGATVLRSQVPGPAAAGKVDIDPAPARSGNCRRLACLRYCHLIRTLGAISA